jgi:hypothetical protein
MRALDSDGINGFFDRINTINTINTILKKAFRQELPEENEGGSRIINLMSFMFLLSKPVPQSC